MDMYFNLIIKGCVVASQLFALYKLIKPDKPNDKK